MQVKFNFFCISEKNVRLKFNPIGNPVCIYSERAQYNYIGALDMATTVRALDLDTRGANMDLDCVEIAPATISCICKYQTGTFQVTVVNNYHTLTEK